MFDIILFLALTASQFVDLPSNITFGRLSELDLLLTSAIYFHSAVCVTRLRQCPLAMAQLLRHCVLTCFSCLAGPDFAYPPPQVDGCPPACPVAELAGPPDDLAFPAPDTEIGTSHAQHNGLTILHVCYPLM